MNNCNPLLLNCKDSELIEYINHNKKIKKKVMGKSLDNKDWECCICLGGYIKEKKYICMPFNCDHDICFSCFSKLCNSTKKYTKDNISKDICCPLCREKPNKYWKNSERVKFQWYKFKDYYEYVYLTLPDINID
tara:strand:- start:344 stop:745 length:402 start_codon:yes stop_codon:yes gene_type:complete